MKILFLLLFTLSLFGAFADQTFAEEKKIEARKVEAKEGRKSGTETGTDTEKVVFQNLRKVKNQEINKYLLDNEAIKECKEQAGGDKTDFSVKATRKGIRECFQLKLGDLTDEQILKLSEDLNLEGYGVVKDNSIPAIKDYFDERLSEALYGVKNTETDGMKKLRDQKFVDHKTFLDLYNSQLSKNSVTKISEFCLENNYIGKFGQDDKTNPTKVTNPDSLPACDPAKIYTCFEPQSKKYKDVEEAMKRIKPMS
jgi:hypothetical protein